MILFSSISLLYLTSAAENETQTLAVLSNTAVYLSYPVENDTQARSHLRAAMMSSLAEPLIMNHDPAPLKVRALHYCHPLHLHPRGAAEYISSPTIVTITGYHCYS